jgi:hypothetical protein
MNLYNLMLFVHVASDITLFIAIGTQVLALVMLRRVNAVEQVRPLIELIPVSNRIGVGGALLTIGSGLYLALSVWGLRTGWIMVTLGSIGLLLPPLVAGVIEPRMHAILKGVREMPDGPLPPSLAARLQDPLLGTALHTNLLVVLGIVFLMTNKPSLIGSIAAMTVALALGLASALPLWTTNRRGTRASL